MCSSLAYGGTAEQHTLADSLCPVGIGALFHLWKKEIVMLNLTDMSSNSYLSMYIITHLYFETFISNRC